MKLLESILRGNYHTNPDAKELKGMIRSIQNEIVAVDVNNVSQWHLAQPNNPVVYQHCPARLPFPVIWLEWEDTDEEGWTLIFGTLLIEENIDDHTSIQAFTFFNSPEQNALVFMMEPTSSDGITINEMRISSYEPDFIVDDEKHKEDRTSLAQYISGVITASLVFFSCKNSSLKRINQTKHSKAFRKKHNIILPEVHIIEVHKVYSQTGKHHSNQNYSLPSGSYLVKGHYKHYTEERPLMGKIVGTYFWNARVAGTGPRLHHDYRVWPPTKEHNPDCEINKP